MLFVKSAPQATGCDADANNLWQLYRPVAAGQRCRLSGGASCRRRSTAVTVKAFALFAQVDPQQAAKVKLFLLSLHLSIAGTSDSSSHPRNGDPGAASSKSSQASPHLPTHSALICPLMPGSALCRASKCAKSSQPVLFIYSLCRGLQQGPAAIMFLLTLHLHFLLHYLSRPLSISLWAGLICPACRILTAAELKTPERSRKEENALILSPAPNKSHIHTPVVEQVRERERETARE